MLLITYKIPVQIQQIKKEATLKKYGIDIDKGKFCDYLSSNFPWFGDTWDDTFPETSKEDEPMTFRRIDHMMTDIDIEGKRIILNIQRGDPFLESAKSVISTMNSTLLKKHRGHYFVLNEKDYF